MESEAYVMTGSSLICQIKNNNPETMKYWRWSPAGPVLPHGEKVPL